MRACRGNSDNAIGRVGYFGLMQEAVTERVAYEIRHRDADGDGPILGDMEDPWSASASWSFWASFLRL